MGTLLEDRIAAASDVSEGAPRSLEDRLAAAQAPRSLEDRLAAAQGNRLSGAKADEMIGIAPKKNAAGQVQSLEDTPFRSFAKEVGVNFLSGLPELAAGVGDDIGGKMRQAATPIRHQKGESRWASMWAGDTQAEPPVSLSERVAKGKAMLEAGAGKVLGINNDDEQNKFADPVASLAGELVGQAATPIEAFGAAKTINRVVRGEGTIAEAVHVLVEMGKNGASATELAAKNAKLAKRVSKIQKMSPDAAAFEIDRDVLRARNAEHAGEMRVKALRAAPDAVITPGQEAALKRGLPLVPDDVQTAKVGKFAREGIDEGVLQAKIKLNGIAVGKRKVQILKELGHDTFSPDQLAALDKGFFLPENAAQAAFAKNDMALLESQRLQRREITKTKFPGLTDAEAEIVRQNGLGALPPERQTALRAAQDAATQSARAKLTKGIDATNAASPKGNVTVKVNDAKARAIAEGRAIDFSKSERAAIQGAREAKGLAEATLRGKVQEIEASGVKLTSKQIQKLRDGVPLKTGEREIDKIGLSEATKKRVTEYQRAKPIVEEFRAAGAELTPAQTRLAGKGFKDDFENSLTPEQTARHAEYKAANKSESLYVGLDAEGNRIYDTSNINTDGTVVAAAKKGRDTASLFAEPMKRKLSHGIGSVDKEAARKLDLTTAEHSQRLGEASRYTDEIKKWKPEEQKRAAHYLDGTRDAKGDLLVTDAGYRAASPEQHRYALSMRTMLQQIGEEMKQMGVKLNRDGTEMKFALHDFFFPHRGTPEGDAIISKYFHRAGRRSRSTFSRIQDGEDFSLEAGNVLHDYLDTTLRQIAEHRNFGSGLAVGGGTENAGITRMTNKALKMGASPESAKQLQHFLQKSLGGDVTSLDAIAKPAGVLTNIAGMAHLSMSAVINATQSIFTYAITDTPSMMHAFKEVLPNIFTKEGRAYLGEVGRMSGATTNSIEKEIMGHMKGWTAKGLEFTMKYSGFNSVERGNRVAAAMAGTEWGERAASVALGKSVVGWKATSKEMAKATEALEKAGVDMERVKRYGGLAPEDRQAVAFHISEKSQLGTRPEDNPYMFANGPLARVFFQFKAYPVKAAWLLIDEVVKPALKGNFKPYLRYLAAGVPVMTLAYSVLDVAKGREVDLPHNMRKSIATLHGMDTVLSFFRENDAQGFGIGGTDIGRVKGIALKGGTRVLDDLDETGVKHKDSFGREVARETGRMTSIGGVIYNNTPQGQQDLKIQKQMKEREQRKHGKYRRVIDWFQ